MNQYDRRLQKKFMEQFGASIDMLKNAIALWPEECWYTRQKFFYTAYYCLVFLDYYLTVPSPENFSSPLSFTLKASGGVPADALDDVIPDRVYNKKELLSYLQLTREKFHKLIAGPTAEKLEEPWKKNWEI